MPDKVLRPRVISGVSFLLLVDMFLMGLFTLVAASIMEKQLYGGY